MHRSGHRRSLYPQRNGLTSGRRSIIAYHLFFVLLFGDSGAPPDAARVYVYCARVHSSHRERCDLEGRRCSFWTSLERG